MKNFFSMQYWFTVNPERLSTIGFYFLIGLMVVLIIVAVITLIGKQRGGLYRKTLNRLYNFSWANIILGIIFLFFNYENIPFFAARFWLAGWAISMIAWLFFIYQDLKEVPAKRLKLEAERERKKYLPN